MVARLFPVETKDCAADWANAIFTETKGFSPLSMVVPIQIRAQMSSSGNTLFCKILPQMNTSALEQLRLGNHLYSSHFPDATALTEAKNFLKLRSVHILSSALMHIATM